MFLFRLIKACLIFFFCIFVFFCSFSPLVSKFSGCDGEESNVNKRRRRLVKYRAGPNEPNCFAQIEPADETFRPHGNEPRTNERAIHHYCLYGRVRLLWVNGHSPLCQFVV